MKKIYFSILICIMLFAVVALALVGCNNNALPRPVGLKLDGPTMTLSWKADARAKYYIVKINGNGMEDEKNTRKNSLSLANLGLVEGDYQLSVKACADGKEFSDSAWSEPISFSQDKDTGLTFKFVNNNKEVEVVSLGKALGNVVIPDTYRGVPVTSIGSRAFAGKSGLKGIVISDNVTAIGASAFYNCASLESLTLSKNLTKIGESAFQSCRSLSGTLTIPEKVTEIGKLAFAYCTSITKVEFNAGLESIGDSAFSSCTELTSVDIPDKVQSIGDDAFSLCSKLTSVKFGFGLTSIGEYAFASCANIEQIHFNVGLKTIGKGAFMLCAKLNTVVLSDTVETIADGAFYDATALTNVTFGSGLKRIGLSAFENTVIWDSSGNEVYLGKWFLGFKDSASIGAEVNLAEDTIGIANYAFAGIDETLSYVILPDSVKIIGDAAFATSKMSTVVIGEGATEIGQQAFYNCDKLTTVVLGAYDRVNGIMLGSSLKVINERAFYGCSQLASIEIPSTVEVINTYAFNKTAMYENATDGIVYADNWLVACNNARANGTVVVKNGTVGIANYAFYKCENISAVKIPDSVKTIGRAAFYLCSNLASVELPSTLEVIEDYTFYSCTKLAVPTLPQTLKSIGRSAFYKCALSNGSEADTDNDVLIIPDSVITIGDYAFYGSGYTTLDLEDYSVLHCGIDAVILGNGVTYVGEYAFYNIGTLKSVTLGDNVKSIGAKAFYKCEALSEIVFNRDLQSIGERAFYGCNSITNLILPEELTEIGNYAFYKCIGLTDVTFGSNVRSIGEYAFYGCAKLTDVVLSDSVSAIGKQAFRACTGLTSVTLNSNIQSIDAHAFYGCGSLTIYAQDAAAQTGWDARFNSAYRPVVWGCTITDGYVYSVTKNTNTVKNLNSTNKLSAPHRAGYEFVGWSTEKDATVAQYTAEQLESVDNGTTLYSVWVLKANKD